MQFEDTENFRGGDKDNFSQICFWHLRKCVEEGSKEMDGGGVRKRIINGEAVEIFVKNQREIYVRSVDNLYVLLSGKLKGEKDLYEEFQELIDEIGEDFDEIELNSQKKGRGLSNRFNSLKVGMSSGELNQKELRQVKYARIKFLILNELLERHNYFDEAGGMAV